MARTPLQIIKIGLLALVIALTAFTRFYRLPETYNFHNDEGRDVLITARMIWEKRPVLLGPQTSTGNMYLGPFYYYLMVPPLYLANFDPVGPAYMVGVFAVITSALLVFITYRRHGLVASLIAGLIFAALPGIVNFTRQSWNPNVVPFFAMLLILLFPVLSRKRKPLWAWLSLGVVSGVLAQLHYVALILPAYMALTLMAYPQSGKSRLGSVLAIVAGFTFALAPFWLFEARHGFINSRAFFSFLADRGAEPVYGSYLTRLLNNSKSLMDNLVGTKAYRLGEMPTLVIVSGWLIVAAGFFSRGHLTRILAYLFPFSLLIFSLLDEKLHLHYFGFLFPAFVLLAGRLFAARTPLALKLLGLVTTSLILGYNLPILGSRLTMDPEAQPTKTAEVADYIRREAGSQPFNVSPGPTNSRDTTYLYALYRQEPTPSMDRARLLFLICEDGPCGQSDIAGPHLYSRGPSHPALENYLGHPYLIEYIGPREVLKHEHVSYGTWVATLELP